MLPARVSTPATANPSPEDIFASSLSILYTDDTQNSHGMPGEYVTYRSPRFGDIKLGIPRHPDVEEGRKLFAHYLWNAGVVVADAIEVSSHNDDADSVEKGKVQWSKSWDVRNKDVLEIGAAYFFPNSNRRPTHTTIWIRTALPSLISARCGARSITITDHPASPAITTNTIAQNVQFNLNRQILPSPSPSPPRVTSSFHTNTTTAIHGLVWGTTTFTTPDTEGKPSTTQPAHHSFDTIIIADCLWMPSQHANLVTTINDFLKYSSDTTEINRGESHAGEMAREEACALVIGGFHTGRAVVAAFFENATGSTTGVRGRCEDVVGELHKAEDGEDGEDTRDGVMKQGGGTLTAAEIFEIDVDCNVRSWLPVREGESKQQAARWCVCAVLVR